MIDQSQEGYLSNLACDWLSIVWAYSEQETGNGPRTKWPTCTRQQFIMPAILWHRSRLTLAQAPSHYLNKCWLIIIEVLWHSTESIFIAITQAAFWYNEFENYMFKITSASPIDEWGKMLQKQYFALGNGLLPNRLRAIAGASDDPDVVT